MQLIIQSLLLYYTSERMVVACLVEENIIENVCLVDEKFLRLLAHMLKKDQIVYRTIF